MSWASVIVPAGDMEFSRFLTDCHPFEVAASSVSRRWLARAFAARIASPIPMMRPQVRRYAISPTTLVTVGWARLPRGGMKRYAHAA